MVLVPFTVKCNDDDFFDKSMTKISDFFNFRQGLAYQITGLTFCAFVRLNVGSRKFVAITVFGFHSILQLKQPRDF